MVKIWFRYGSSRLRNVGCPFVEAAYLVRTTLPHTVAATSANTKHCADPAAHLAGQEENGRPDWRLRGLPITGLHVVCWRACEACERKPTLSEPRSHRCRRMSGPYWPFWQGLFRHICGESQRG